MTYWNFPAVAGGSINSINNAGLETFRDNPIDSLTREVCQNSLDAIKDPTKPVKVEFNTFITDFFPKRDELINALRKAKNTWLNKTEKKNEKVLKFINRGLELLENREIEFIRISDFNTIGLVGAKEEKFGTAWSSLIKEAGSSNKDDDSGGSFGIGKAAPFLSSELRTLFYSSYDECGYKSHIGVSDIMSFHKENNLVTIGKGFYTKNDNSDAIEGLLNLEPERNRDECGTDIFVAAFKRIDNWKNEMILSVLKNFFVTIFEKLLIVKINGFQIDHKNIADLIARLDDNDENQMLKQYFSLLTSERTIRIPYPKQSFSNSKGEIDFEEGEAELLLMDGEDLNRCVLMTRKNGMRIYEQNRISGSISFTGLLIMKGKNMNKVFKQMENPAHDKWIPKRYEENPILADKIYSDLRRFLRDSVKDTFQQNATDSMNAVGLSDFLPNRNLLEEDGTKKVESIETRVKSIGIKKIEQKPSKKAKSRGNNPIKTEEQILGELGITDGEESGHVPGEGGSGGGGGGGTTEPGGERTIDPDKVGNVGVKEKKAMKSVPVKNQQKYACANKKAGQYRFTIMSQKVIKRGELKFKVMGEQTDFDLPIVQAKFADNRIVVDSISDNTILFSSTVKTKTLNIDIQIDYSDYCVMEVSVYEVK
ncbi:hypothetical protein CN490_22560 [Bacillus cereus]|nr:hypothetical protein CN490_22560 [Bacillus cereus]